MLLALRNFPLSVLNPTSRPENGNRFISNGRGGGDLIQKIDYEILEGLEVQIRKGKRFPVDK